MGLDFTPVIDGLPFLLKGAFVTLQVTFASLGISLVLGLLAGIARLKRKKQFTYYIASSYVAVIRGTPLLVQLFILFFGLPQLGIRLPAFLCAVLGLGIYSGAYMTEIVRGAIQSIDKGQIEAARCLGMSERQTTWKIVLPQAFLRMLPPLGNEVIALVKNSALVSLLTIDDLMREGQRIISVSFRSLEVYLTIAVVYLIITSVASFLIRKMEKRLRLEGMMS
jgi:polar amino acid transport system permease protein